MDTSPAPSEVAPDTFVVHDHLADDLGRLVPGNVLLIRGAEPVVVDTGAAEHRDRLLDDLFGLVAPDDIRWVFVSHDDADHIGNLDALLAVAPNARVVRATTDGRRLDVGDRRLVVVCPPVYDHAPTSGLFDPTTGVWWAADAFATTVAAPVATIDEVEADAWAARLTACAGELAPWLALVDDGRFQRSVDRAEAAGMSTIVGAHTPAIGHRRVHEAWSLVRRLPATVAARTSGHDRNATMALRG
jgi:glyoxylase-like metal-dependent hydrolase (beta-lactamase superfamily II)